MADEPTPQKPEPADDAAAAAEVKPVPAVPPPPPPPPLTPAVPDTGYTTAGVPTFEGVREKIETRYGTALGATELAAETPEVRTAAQRYEDRQKAAADKLEEIRAAMRPAGTDGAEK